MVKGVKLNSPIAKIQAYADLHGRGIIKKEFGLSSFNNWTIIQIPDGFDYYYYHNLAYWFLGFGEDDLNFADEIIGIAINKIYRNEDYLIYNDNRLREELGIKDDLFVIKRSNTKFIVSIPFDVSLEIEKDFLPDYEKFQIIYGFNVSDIRNLEFDAKPVLFNE